MAASEYTISTGHGTDRATTSPSLIRTFGMLCVAGGLIAAVGALWSSTVDPVVASDRLSYPFSPGTFRVTEVIWTLTHVLTFFGALALPRVSRIGTPLMLAGMALLVPCELGFAFVATSAESSGGVLALDAAIGIAATLAGVGFTLVGIAVVRQGHWTGWARWTPLVVGVYELLVMTAVAPLSGPVFLAGIAGWNLCLAALGAALWVRRVG